MDDLLRFDLHVSGSRTIAAPIPHFLNNVFVKDDLDIPGGFQQGAESVSYTHLTLPTN